MFEREHPLLYFFLVTNQAYTRNGGRPRTPANLVILRTLRWDAIMIGGFPPVV